MADWSPYTKNHFPFSELNSPIQPSRRTQGKSFTNFLCKSLFFALFLILLPLFPSQAPEFINQKFLTKFWELLHLLFIGIAVSYGLFGRRNVELGIDETHSNFDISQSSVSRMFHVSSIFEDGFENPCGPDENSLINSWNSQYIESEHINSCDRSSGVGEKCKSRYGRDRNNVVQAWNSQYFQGEPTVVVAQPNFSVEKWGRTASLIDHKPLGLPVRSLKSKVRKLDCPEFISGSESGSGSNVTSRSDRSRSGNFGDLGPMNLEQSFNEAAAAASPIPWRSRSIRTETRNEAGDVNLPTHFRPLSVDETQIESLKSRSVRSTGSFSSQSSSVSSSSSISSELPNSRTEDLGKSKSFLGAFREASPSPSPPTPRNGKASSNALHSRHCSSGSVSGRDAFRNSEDELKEKSRSRREDPSDSEDCRMDLLKSNMNPASPTKAFLRGKSVRNASSNALHSRHCSSGSVSGRDAFRKSEDELKEKSRSRREDPSDSEDCRMDLLKSNMNPASPTKAFLRGKSVRNASSNALHSRHCSSGSLSGRDAFRKSEDELKEKSRSRREDPSDSEDCRMDLLKSNMNPASPTKAFLRGKSVRTIRASGLTAGAIKKEERRQNQNNDKAEKKHQNLDEACMRKDKTKVGLDDWMIGSSEQHIDNLCPMPKATFSEFRKKEKEEFYENLAAGSEEDLQSERENLEVSSDEYDVSGSVNDSVPSSDEVDKKADEFIAKFREQIMLQKMASIERSRGLQMGRNRFR